MYNKYKNKKIKKQTVLNNGIKYNFIEGRHGYIL